MNITLSKYAVIFIIFLIIPGMIIAKQFKVLLFTETEDYHHQSIAAGVQAMRKMAEKHHFDLDWTEVSKVFTESSLNEYDVVIFLNTDGDVLTPEEQQGLKKFYQSGKGFVGIHGAAATELEWQWFGRLIGRQFIVHPAIQSAEIKIIDNDFPATYHLPDKMVWTDEWYEFGPELTDKLNYLITVDEKTYDPVAKWSDNEGQGMGDFHPIAWYQKFDGGRSFYTALGHLDEAFHDHQFLKHLYGGLYWTAKSEQK